MSISRKIEATVRRFKQIGQSYLEKYITFNPELKQLTLKKKTVLLLCQKAESRVEKLKSLKPDVEEGLIAKIEYKEVLATVHFTPEKIILNKNCIEGQLRLLNSPIFKTKSLFHLLIVVWKKFLGTNIAPEALPDKLQIEGDKIFYSFPRNQVQLLEALFSGLEDGSVLKTNLSKEELIIKASVALNWRNFKIQQILQIINANLKDIHNEQ